ncbi:MAG: LamG domain-containing protein, partial [Bacteroidota bacterium]
SMHFDNLSSYGENDTHVYDFSGSGNNGTVISATATSEGKYDGAFEFDGVNDYVDCGDDSSLNINSVFTITSWIYPRSVGASDGAVIVFKWDDSTGTDNSYFFRLTNTRYLRIGLKDETGTNRLYSDTVSQIPLNQMSFVSGQYDGTYLKLFLNGNFLSQLNIGSHTIKQTADNVWIGRQVDYPSVDNAFNGSIDQVMIFNRSLSADEINELYVKGKLNYDYTGWQNVSEGIDTTTFVTAEQTEYVIPEFMFYSDGYGFSTPYLKSGQIGSWGINLSGYEVPEVSFVPPTLSNDSATANTWFEVNATIENADDLDEVQYNFNGTNFTMFNDSLVLMMNFDNVSALGENDTLVKYLSGYGNDGTISGSSWNSTGKYGGAFEFDGVDDWVKIYNDDSLMSVNLTNEISIGFWFKSNLLITDYPSSWPRVLGKGAYNLGYEVYFTTSTGTIGKTIMAWNGTDNNRLIFNSLKVDFNKDQWYHVVFNYDGGGGSNNMKVYIDGVLDNQATKTGNINIDNSGMGIGSGSGGSNYFNGSIDEVQIWNRFLSASEIYQQYISNLNKYDTDKWNLYVNQSLNATNGLTDGTYTYQVFAEDTSGNLNFTDLRTVSVDSVGCACPGLNQNWGIDLSKRCSILSDCALGTGKLSFTGSGIVTCDAAINTTGLGDPGANGKLIINDNCRIWVI